MQFIHVAYTYMWNNWKVTDDITFPYAFPVDTPLAIEGLREILKANINVMKWVALSDVTILHFQFLQK